jgi:hypothetical protein
VDVVDAELRGDAAEPVADGGVDFGLAVDGSGVEEERDALEENVKVAPLAGEAGSGPCAEIREPLAERGRVDVDGGHLVRIPAAVGGSDGGEGRAL